jgi:hypothetical protein
MPVINSAHVIDIDLLEYVPKSAISPAKLADTTALLAHLLIERDLPPVAVSCGTKEPTISILYRSQFEAIRADDLIDGWLTHLGAGLEASIEAIRKSFDEKASKKAKRGNPAPGDSERNMDELPDDSGLSWLK